jgi:uncharacterized protein (TIGR04222 family)
MNWLQPFSLDGQGFLVFYGTLLAVCTTVAVMLRWLVSRWLEPDDVVRGPARDLSPYELAWLRGGDTSMAMTGIADLSARGWIGPDPARSRFVALRDARPDRQEHVATRLHPVPHALFSLAASADGLQTRQLRREIASVSVATRRKMEAAGHARTAASRWILALPALTLLGTCLAIAAARLVQGALRDRPVGYLLLLTLLTAVAMAILSCSRRLTRQGRTILAEAQAMARTRGAEKSRPQLTPDEAPGAAFASGSAAALTMALLGPSYANAEGHIDDATRKLLDRPEVSGAASSTSGGDGGSGCGGGGCGGGCGGCGS